jgi:hypothetical protein
MRRGAAQRSFSATALLLQDGHDRGAHRRRARAARVRRGDVRRAQRCAAAAARTGQGRPPAAATRGGVARPSHAGGAAKAHPWPNARPCVARVAKRGPPRRSRAFEWCCAVRPPAAARRRRPAPRVQCGAWACVCARCRQGDGAAHVNVASRNRMPSACAEVRPVAVRAVASSSGRGDGDRRVSSPFLNAYPRRIAALRSDSRRQGPTSACAHTYTLRMRLASALYSAHAAAL